jgi:hypothetical protein
MAQIGAYQAAEVASAPRIYFVRFYVDGKPVATQKLVLVK